MTRKERAALAKVDARKATFDDWFIAQFGERPSKLSIFDLQNIAENARYAAQNTALTLAQVEDWENQKQAASYAWQASKMMKG